MKYIATVMTIGLVAFIAARYAVCLLHAFKASGISTPFTITTEKVVSTAILAPVLLTKSATVSIKAVTAGRILITSFTGNHAVAARCTVALLSTVSNISPLGKLTTLATPNSTIQTHFAINAARMIRSDSKIHVFALLLPFAALECLFFHFADNG
jgi:hypothetical protein